MYVMAQSYLSFFGVCFQQIVLNVWLPRFLGTDISPYTGYKSSVFPGISHAFQTSAMRFGHTLVPPQAYRAFVK